MAAFEYQALDAKGKQQKGVMEADSARQIRQQLREKGWMPLSVEATTVKQKGESAGLFNRGPSLSVPELALITRQLATLIQAGLPIDESLRALSEQTGKQKIKAMILAIRSKVLEGYTLAKALEEYPRAFPHLYRSTVAAGEHAGHLDGVLNRLADYTESRQASDQKIKLAAMYPIILSIVAIGIAQQAHCTDFVVCTSDWLTKETFMLVTLLSGCAITDISAVDRRTPNADGRRYPPRAEARAPR